MQIQGGNESPSWAAAGPGAGAGPSGGGNSCLFQAPLRDLLLIPAEIVAQLVEISQPDLVAEHSLVALRVVPQVFEEEEDLGRQRRALGDLPPLTVKVNESVPLRFAEGT